MVRFRPSGRTSNAIVESVERALRSGTLTAGTSLPPVRELAASLRVSPATVASAYRTLRMRGLVSADGRRGTWVRPEGAGPAEWAGASWPPLPSSGDHPRPGARALPRHAPLHAPVDLATGNPDPLLLPPLEPVLRTLSVEPRLYGGPLHLPALVRFAAGDFEADGVPAAHLLVTGGALDALDRLFREYLRPGDRVAVEDPCAPAVLDLCAVSGLATVPFAVDDDGPVVEAFAAALSSRPRALVLTTRAQNPSGAVLGEERALELARVLLRHPDLLVVENDPCGPVAGAPARTLCGNARHHWAVIRSTSRFLGPDLRLALVAGDALTIARVERRQRAGAGWVSHILQHLALSLWSDPAGGRRLARAAGVYAQRRTSLLHALSAQGIAAHGRSGFNVWVPVPEESVVVQRLAERGWAVAAGERFRLATGPAIRITAAALSADDAIRLAGDLAESLRQGAATVA